MPYSLLQRPPGKGCPLTDKSPPSPCPLLSALLLAPNLHLGADILLDAPYSNHSAQYYLADQS